MTHESIVLAGGTNKEVWATWTFEIVWLGLEMACFNVLKRSFKLSDLICERARSKLLSPPFTRDQRHVFKMNVLSRMLLLGRNLH
jgi:hypothetical protein